MARRNVSQSLPGDEKGFTHHVTGIGCTYPADCEAGQLSAVVIE